MWVGGLRGYFEVVQSDEIGGLYAGKDTKLHDLFLSASISVILFVIFR